MPIHIFESWLCDSHTQSIGAIGSQLSAVLQGDGNHLIIVTLVKQVQLQYHSGLVMLPKLMR